MPTEEDHQVDLQKEMDTIIAKTPFREAVFDLIPVGSRKILDFGCNQGELLLRLKRDKECRDLYGVEISEGCRNALDKHLDGAWIMDIAEEDADLGRDYHGFFNYIILHDVVEHLYDPWFVLGKLRRYLSPDGMLILVTPNFQYWGFIKNLLQGNFFYGTGGGLMNEDHIRWFTYPSLLELVTLAGFDATRFQLLFPPDTELDEFNGEEIRSVLKLPPTEVGSQDPEAYSIELPAGIGKEYLFYLANKILLCCKPRETPQTPERIKVGGLEARRRKTSKVHTHSWH